MYSSRYGFIYLHVSKTGGNSIQHRLLPFSDDRATRRAHQDGEDRFGVTGPYTARKHSGLQDYADRLPGGLKDTSVVVSVRHPFERAVSAYLSPHRWMQAQGNGGFVKTDPIWDPAAFEQLIESAELPAVGQMLQLDGQLRRPDIVIRHEALQDSFAAAVKRLNLPEAEVAPLPHVNRSANAAGLAQQMLTDRTLQSRVETRFAEDMALFDYPSYPQFQKA